MDNGLCEITIVTVTKYEDVLSGVWQLEVIRPFYHFTINWAEEYIKYNPGLITVRP